MDPSLQYVRMCKGATEIQNQWKFELGDYFSTIRQTALHERNLATETDDRKGFSIVDSYWLNDELTKKRIPEPWVWLPRQDQLQEMLSDEHRIFYKDTVGKWPAGFIFMVVLDRFRAFLECEYDYTELDSAEQIWLAYVMDHVHEKRWDGSTWIPRNIH